MNNEQQKRTMSTAHLPQPATIKSFQDEMLLSETKRLVGVERETTTAILHMIGEVESRGLHLERGYANLYDYLIHGLGYSGGAAHRRILALRLLKSLPEDSCAKTEEKLNSGTLSLTNIASLQGFLQAQKKEMGKTYFLDQKHELLSLLESKSKREVEKIFAAEAPDLVPVKESIRVVSQSQSRVSFIAPERLIVKLDRIKHLTAHKNPHGGHAELIEMMADLVLKKIDPMEKLLQGRTKTHRSEQATKIRASAGIESLKTPPAGFMAITGNDISNTKISSSNTSQTSNGKQVMAPKNIFTKVHNNALAQAHKNALSKNPHYIPAPLKREVWVRDQGRCQYRDPLSSRQCSSTHALQYDHVTPVALGGQATLEGLRLMCRHHNIHLAAKVFGAKYMDQFKSKT